MKTTPILVITALCLWTSSLFAAGDEYLKISAGELRVIIGEQASIPERSAAELYAKEIRRRTGLEIPIVTNGASATTRYSLCILTKDQGRSFGADKTRERAAAALGDDGFYFSGKPNRKGQILIVGANPGNAVAGVGKLLRTSRYADGSLRLPRKVLKETPGMPVRGIYFATHFLNFYHAAPLEEVDAVIDECALWGLNQLVIWFDMHHYAGLDTPDAQKHLARLKHFRKTAQDVGMQVGLVFLGNEGYATTPEPLRAKFWTNWSHYNVEVCPSKPEGLALLARNQAGVLDEFHPVDFIWSWPYDQGGCDCNQCRPWGCNGFLKASEQLARLFHERNPSGKVWLSTWFFDTYKTDGPTKVEYAGLNEYLRERQPDWMAGIVACGIGDFLPQQLLERPFPERYPLVGFPEISTHQMVPWGGCGANPIPQVATKLAAKMRGKLIGGWPYSEGIWEDINKFVWAGFYWSPTRSTADILTEYASYYLSPDSAAEGSQLFHLLEKTLPRKNLQTVNLEEADEAWRLAQAINARIPALNRTSWRWRIIHIRANIDHVLKNQGYQSPEAKAALRPLFDELVAIYHAERTFIRPPKLDE